MTEFSPVKGTTSRLNELTYSNPGICAKFGKRIIENLAIAKEDKCFVATAKITGIALLSLSLLVLAIVSFGLVLIPAGFIAYEGYQLFKKQEEPLHRFVEQKNLTPQIANNLDQPPEPQPPVVPSKLRNIESGSKNASFCSPPVPETETGFLAGTAVQSLSQSQILPNLDQSKKVEANKAPLSGIPNPKLKTCYMGTAVMSLYYIRHLFENNSNPAFQAIMKSYENPEENFIALQDAIQALAPNSFNPNIYGDAEALLCNLLFEIYKSNPEFEKPLSLEVKSCTCTNCKEEIEADIRDCGAGLPLLLNGNKGRIRATTVPQAAKEIFNFISNGNRCMGKNGKCLTNNPTPIVLPKYFILSCQEPVELIAKFTSKGHDFRVLAALQVGNGKSVGHAMPILPDNIENPQVWYQYNDEIRLELNQNSSHYYKKFLIENISYKEDGESLLWIGD